MVKPKLVGLSTDNFTDKERNRAEFVFNGLLKIEEDIEKVKGPLNKLKSGTLTQADAAAIRDGLNDFQVMCRKIDHQGVLGRSRVSKVIGSLNKLK